MLIGGLFRLFRTVRHLRLSQILHRAALRLPRWPTDEGPAPERRSLPGPFVDPIPFPTRIERSEGDEPTFRFQGLPGSPKDWHRTDRPLLWQFHLHYFEDLLDPDGAISGEAARSWIRDWVAENPVGKGPGWHPYPLSRRMVNWMLWAAWGNDLPSEAVGSLATQIRFLEPRLERHLGGNHLLVNARALAAAGLFHHGEEADRWYRKGMEILDEALGEQVLLDGGHYERSPSYHGLVLVDLLDLVNLHRAAGRPVPEGWSGALLRMTEWCGRMGYRDGGFPFFNDANEDMAPARRAILGYADALGLAARDAEGRAGSELAVQDLPDTGYLRVDGPGFRFFMDLAPLGPDDLPGHGHADTLSYEIAVGGDPVVVDSGVSTYEAGEIRAWERATVAHNTVTVDRRDSSEVWSSFRVGRRARIVARSWERGRDEVAVVGAHDGYDHLGCRHVRTCTLRRNELTISDRVEGGEDRRLESHLHLHPGIEVRRLGGSRFALEGSTARVKLEVVSPSTVRVEESSYAPRFGVRIPRPHLVVEAPTGRKQIAYVLRWNPTVLFYSDEEQT